jgi:hypothetical protein
MFSPFFNLTDNFISRNGEPRQCDSLTTYGWSINKRSRPLSPSLGKITTWRRHGSYDPLSQYLVAAFVQRYLFSYSVVLAFVINLVNLAVSLPVGVCNREWIIL